MAFSIKFTEGVRPGKKLQTLKRSAEEIYDASQGSRWRAIRAKKSPCGCSLRFILVPKEKWKSPCDFTKSLC